MSYRSISILLLTIASKLVPAQVQVMNDGALVKVDAQLVMIDGNIVHQNNGSITNSGDIYITGNWTNNNPAGNVYAPVQPGWTHLTGASQNITGTQRTLFNKLELAGTGIKSLVDISAIVEDTLALNDREFDADTNTVFVTGTGTGLITRTTGFVSSLSNGGLSRNMLAASVYLFPVGSSVGTLRYRPVELLPGSATGNTYKVRMANVDPTTESFNRNFIDTILCNINPLFYHRISHTAGASAADITIYFDPVADGTYQTMAHWQNQPRWESIGNSLPNPVNPPLTGITRSAWNSFSYTPFALANIAPVAMLSDTTICEGDAASFIATAGYNNYDFYVNGTSVQNSASNVFTSANLNNGDIITVVPSNNATCPGVSNAAVITVNPLPNVAAAGTTTVHLGETVTLSASGAQTYVWDQGSTGPQLTVTPSASVTYVVTGTNSYGCSDTASISLIVDSECGEVFVPTAFSPNGDGRNDMECVLGYCVSSMYFVIYDRWGEKMFESTDREICWDGTYKGKPLNSAVFVYYLTAELITGKTITQKGDISLVR